MSTTRPSAVSKDLFIKLKAQITVSGKGKMKRGEAISAMEKMEKKEVKEADPKAETILSFIKELVSLKNELTKLIGEAKLSGPTLTATKQDLDILNEFKSHYEDDILESQNQFDRFQTRSGELELILPKMKEMQVKLKKQEKKLDSAIEATSEIIEIFKTLETDFYDLLKTIPQDILNTTTVKQLIDHYSIWIAKLSDYKVGEYLQNPNIYLQTLSEIAGNSVKLMSEYIKAFEKIQSLGKNISKKAEKEQKTSHASNPSTQWNAKKTTLHQSVSSPEEKKDDKQYR